MNTLNDTLAQLRSLLHSPPSTEIWEALCTLFDAPMADDTLRLCLDYTLPLLDERWPDRLRPPPRRWRLESTDKKPLIWPLVRGFDIELLDRGPRWVHVVKIVREATELGLKESNALTCAAPTLLVAGLGLTQAEQLAARLTDVGASVNLVPHAQGTHPLNIFDVHLLGAGPSPIRTIMTLSRLTPHNFEKARSLTETLPATVEICCPRPDAQQLFEALEEAGASPCLVPHGRHPPSPPNSPQPPADLFLSALDCLPDADPHERYHMGLMLTEDIQAHLTHITTLLENADLPTLHHLAQLLGEITHPDVPPHLETLSTHADPDIRQEASRQLHTLHHRLAATEQVPI